MKGTEKQVKWAEDIKVNILTALDAMSNTKLTAEFKSFREWLDSKDNASWWINIWTQTMTDNMFLRCAMREYKA